MPDTDDGYNDQDDSGNQPDYDDDDSDNSAGLLDGVDTFLGMLPQLVISGVIVVVVIQVINVFNGPMVTTIGNAFGNMFATGTELLKQVPTWVIMYVALQGSTLLINVLIAYISNRSSNPRDKVTTAEEVKLRKKQILNGEIIIDTNRWNASNTGESSNAANRQSKYLHNQGRARGVKDLDHYFNETTNVKKRVGMGTDKVSANAKKQIAGAFFTELQNLGRLQTAIVDAFPSKEDYMEAVKSNPDAVRKQAERIITEAGVKPATLETARFLFGKKYGDAARELNDTAKRNNFINFITLNEAQYDASGTLVGFESAEMDGEVTRFFSEGKRAVFTPNDAKKIMMLARAGENTVYEAARAVSKDAKFKEGDFGNYFNRKGRSFLSRVTGFESFTDSLVFETCGANIMQEQVDEATGKVTVDGNAANLAMHYSTNSENTGTGASFDSGLRDFRSKYIRNNTENQNGRPPSLSTTDPGGGGVSQQSVQLRSEGGSGSNRMLEPDSIDLAHLSDFDYKLIATDCAFFWDNGVAANLQPTGSGNNPPADGAYMDLRSLIDQNLDVEGQSGTNKVTAMSAIDYMERQLNPMYEAMKKIIAADTRLSNKAQTTEIQLQRKHNLDIYNKLRDSYDRLRSIGLKNTLFPGVDRIEDLTPEQKKAIQALLTESERARDTGTGTYTRDSHATFREIFTLTQTDVQGFKSADDAKTKIQEKFADYGDFGKYLADANKHVMDPQIVDDQNTTTIYMDTVTNVMSPSNQALSLMKSDISADKELIVTTSPYSDPDFNQSGMKPEEWKQFQSEGKDAYNKAAYSKGDLDAIRNATISVETKAAATVKDFNKSCIAIASDQGKKFTDLTPAQRKVIVDRVRADFGTPLGMTVDVAMAVFSEDVKGTSRQPNSVTQRLAFGKYEDRASGTGFVIFDGNPGDDLTFQAKVDAEINNFPPTTSTGGDFGQYNAIADAVKTGTRAYAVSDDAHSIAGRMLTVELTAKRLQARSSILSTDPDGNHTGKTRVKVQGMEEPQSGHPIHAMDANLWASGKKILTDYFNSLGVDPSTAFNPPTTVDNANPNSAEFRRNSPFNKETAITCQHQIHNSMDVCYNTDYLRRRLVMGRADAPLRAIQSPKTSVTPRVAVMETLTNLDRIKNIIKQLFPDVGAKLPNFGTSLEKLLVTGGDASLLNPKGSGLTFESSVEKQMMERATKDARTSLQAQSEEEKRSRTMEEESRKQRMEGYDVQRRRG